MSGPGRPSIGAAKRTVQIASYITPVEAEALDRWRESLGGLSRSDALRALLADAVAAESSGAR